MTAYPTRTPLVAAAGGGTEGPNSNPIIYGAVGLAVGVLATLLLSIMYYTAHKQNKQRRSVHLSPQIYFNSTPAQPETFTETKNSSFRALPIQKKVEFEPSHVL